MLFAVARSFNLHCSSDVGLQRQTRLVGMLNLTPWGVCISYFIVSQYYLSYKKFYSWNIGWSQATGLVRSLISSSMNVSLRLVVLPVLRKSLTPVEICSRYCQLVLVHWAQVNLPPSVLGHLVRSRSLRRSRSRILHLHNFLVNKFDPLQSWGVLREKAMIYNIRDVNNKKENVNSNFSFFCNFRI